MTSGDLFNNFKEEIKMALTESKISAGYEDKEGNTVYETATKDEIIQRILNIYDETVYQFIQVNTGAVVDERLRHKYVPDIDEKQFFADYCRLVEEERAKNTYIYEENRIGDEFKKQAVKEMKIKIKDEKLFVKHIMQLIRAYGDEENYISTADIGLSMIFDVSTEENRNRYYEILNNDELSVDQKYALLMCLENNIEK